MRMAGMKWYEISKKSECKKKQYEMAFNTIDSVNFIHSDLEKMVMNKINELNMDIKFRNKFSLDIGTSLSKTREEPYPIFVEKKKTFRMIMATRFSNYQKRQDIIIEATRLLDNNLDYEIIFIGSGSEKDNIQNLILKYGLEDRIKIIPFLEQENLWKLMEESDLLLHACDYEGLGKVIIESMSIGLPVLVSNVGTLNGYIEDGINGFLVSNTASEWAKKIKILMDKKEERIKVSEESIKFVKDRYTPDENIKRYEIEFESIIYKNL
jgi:glycosyltransferase involved in cell wall biosynthesis